MNETEKENARLREMLTQACLIFENRGSRNWLAQTDPHALANLDRWNLALGRPRHNGIKVSVANSGARTYAN